MKSEMDLMREEFEESHSSQGEWPNAIEKNADGGYRLMHAAASWETWQDAWQAARQQAVPSVCPQCLGKGSYPGVYGKHTCNCSAPAERVGQEPYAWVQKLPVEEHQPSKPVRDEKNGYVIPLYTAPQPSPAPASIQLPSMAKAVADDSASIHGFCDGWNNCLIEVARLNESPCISTELDAEQYTAHDMADQAAQGFRDAAPAPGVSRLDLFATRAIGICEGEASEWDSDDLIAQKNYAQACANRIRRLRDEFMQANQNREV